MNLRGLISTIADKVKQVSQVAQTNLGAWTQVAKSPQMRQDYVQTVVKPTVSRVFSAPSAVVNGAVKTAGMMTNPFGRSQLRETVQRVTRPNVAFDKNQFYQVNQEPIRPWNSLSKQEQAKIEGMDAIDDLVYGTQTKNSSAEMRPYFLNPTSEPHAQALRDVQIRKGGYTPQVEQYLKTIPMIMKPEGSKVGVDWSAGGAYTGKNGNGPSFIEVSPKGYSQDNLAGHELMHQIDYVAKSYKPDDFLSAVSKAAQADPRLQPAMDFIAYYQKSQPEYFNNGQNRAAIASETFAEIGSRMGPIVLKNPYLAPFYKGIFRDMPGEDYFATAPGPTPANPNAPKAAPVTKKTIPVNNANRFGYSSPKMANPIKIKVRKAKK